MRSILSFVLAALPGLALVACADFSVPSSVPADSLPRNLHVSHVVQIVGDVDPHFQVRLTAHYATNTAGTECNHTVNYIAGVVSAQYTSVELPVGKRGREVTSSVDVDRFLPGRCQWSLQTVEALVSASDSEQSIALIAIDDGWYRQHNLILTPLDPSHTMSIQQCDYGGLMFSANGKRVFSCHGIKGNGDYLPVDIKNDSTMVQFAIR
jgi:hypothetical protein